VGLLRSGVRQPAASGNEREIEIGYAGWIEIETNCNAGSGPLSTNFGGSKNGIWEFRVKNNGIGIAFENLGTISCNTTGVQDAYSRGGWPIVERRQDRIWANVGTQPLYPSLGPNRNPSGVALWFEASVLEFHYAH
jgi:hypothetical protein